MKTEELLDILNNIQCQRPGGKEKLYILLDHYPCDCAFYEIIKLVVENTNLTSVIAYLINNFHVFDKTTAQFRFDTVMAQLISTLQRKHCQLTIQLLLKIAYKQHNFDLLKLFVANNICSKDLILKYNAISVALELSFCFEPLTPLVDEQISSLLDASELGIRCKSIAYLVNSNCNSELREKAVTYIGKTLQSESIHIIKLVPIVISHDYQIIDVASGINILYFCISYFWIDEEHLDSCVRAACSIAQQHETSVQIQHAFQQFLLKIFKHSSKFQFSNYEQLFKFQIGDSLYTALQWLLKSREYCDIITMFSVLLQSQQSLKFLELMNQSLLEKDIIQRFVDLSVYSYDKMQVCQCFNRLCQFIHGKLTQESLLAVVKSYEPDILIPLLCGVESEVPVQVENLITSIPEICSESQAVAFLLYVKNQLPFLVTKINSVQIEQLLQCFIDLYFDYYQFRKEHADLLDQIIDLYRYSSFRNIGILVQFYHISSNSEQQQKIAAVLQQLNITIPMNIDSFDKDDVNLLYLHISSAKLEQLSYLFSQHPQSIRSFHVRLVEQIVFQLNIPVQFVSQIECLDELSACLLYLHNECTFEEIKFSFKNANYLINLLVKLQLYNKIVSLECLKCNYNIPQLIQLNELVYCYLFEDRDQIQNDEESTAISIGYFNVAKSNTCVQ